MPPVVPRQANTRWLFLAVARYPRYLRFSSMPAERREAMRNDE